MNRHAAIEQDFGDGTYTFRLGLGEIEELERKCDLGIFRIVGRLAPQAREAKLVEIMETLRLGLIGGGTMPVEALALVKRYVEERPLDENRDVAYAVGLAALMRLHSSELEKPPGEPMAAKTMRKKNASISPRSTGQRS
jgi:hypothetical protein